MNQKTVKLKVAKWGVMPSTRIAGEEVRKAIIESINCGASLVEIDFSGVGSISWSFADECFGVLWQSSLSDTLESRLELINADEHTVIPIIRAAVMNRKKAREWERERVMNRRKELLEELADL